MTISHQSDVKVIKRLLLKHPGEAFVSDETSDRQWQELNYSGRPDYARAVEEYDRFFGLDSLYARDASIICNKGIILCNMGKAKRRTEPGAREIAFRAMGIPIHGAIKDGGRVEGGDVAWIDSVSMYMQDVNFLQNDAPVDHYLAGDQWALSKIGPNRFGKDLDTDRQ